MNKVTIEITTHGHKTSVVINGKEFVEEWEPSPSGSRCSNGDFESNEEISEELRSSLSNFTNYDIMKALQSY